MRTLWRSEECWIRTGECWTGLRYDTVRRQLDECTLAVLDGRESAGLANGGTVASLDGKAHSGGAGRSGDCWIRTQWRCWTGNS